MRAAPIVVPAEIADQLEVELEGALEESEHKVRSYSSIAASRVWDVIMGLPDTARASTLRRLGADDRLIAMVDAMSNDAKWRPSDEWFAATDRIVDRIEERVVKVAHAEIADQVPRIASLLGWQLDN
jgi:hypothetical protein